MKSVLSEFSWCFYWKYSCKLGYKYCATAFVLCIFLWVVLLFSMGTLERSLLFLLVAASRINRANRSVLCTGYSTVWSDTFIGLLDCADSVGTGPRWCYFLSKLASSFYSRTQGHRHWGMVGQEFPTYFFRFPTCFLKFSTYFLHVSFILKLKKKL